jgi:hypothetical protein
MKEPLTIKWVEPDVTLLFSGKVSMNSPQCSFIICMSASEEFSEV